MAAEPEEDRLVRTATVALAMLATVAAELAIAEPGQTLAVPLARAAVFSMLAAGYHGWSSRRVSRSFGSWQAVSGGVLLALFLLPLVIEAGSLVWSGRARTLEIVALAALRNLGLGLAALARRPAFARLAALVSLFLVLTASSMIEEGILSVAVPGAYLVAGGLWLVLSYWRSLRLSEGSGRPRRSPVWALVAALGVVGAVVSVAWVGPARAATLLAGFLPSSGGTDWNDPDARGGVNDGDNEVRGSENPQSVGFTDSDLYLETDRPSLYDAFSDMYGEPLKPKTRDRMIALGNADIQEQHERPSENLRAGREFSAVRRPPDRVGRRPADREARALLDVRGPTPLHLGLAAFDRFDGREWDEAPAPARICPLVREPRPDPWFRLDLPVPPLFSGMVSHQIKVGTLDSSPMPVPPHLAAFRIGQVDRPDFFGWSHDGMLKMVGRTVPASTVIETRARTPDPRRLRRVAFPPVGSRAASDLASFGGAYRVAPEVEALARSWIAGLPRGWAQVDAIVSGLRRHAVHDRSVSSPPGCDDVVTHFLMESRRGPDYLFATSAAVLLRSSGYESRVVSGFHVAPERYDPRSRHTPVCQEDVHFWAEVRLPSGVWVAVEPTPGYRVMDPVLGLSDRIRDALGAAGTWARGHAVPLFVVGMLLVVLTRYRRELFDRMATLAWWAGASGSPDRQILRTLNLLERRSRWAGCPRPPGQTPRRWYGTIASATTPALGADLLAIMSLANWSLYDQTGNGLPPYLSDNDARTTCQRAVSGWTLRRFRSTIPPGPRKEPVT